MLKSSARAHHAATKHERRLDPSLFKVDHEPRGQAEVEKKQ